MPLNNSTKKRKKKTKGCSFRIYEEWVKILNEEADKQGISVNSLMNKILRQYSVQIRHLDRFGAVILSRSMFSKILDWCTDDKLKEIAKVVGSIETKDALRTLGTPPTYDKIMNHLKLVGRFGGWFDFNQHPTKNGEYIHLRHELGKKWSVFLAETVSTIFKSLCNKEVKTETFDNCITIESSK
jgi:hypothetical protein